MISPKTLRQKHLAKIGILTPWSFLVPAKGMYIQYQGANRRWLRKAGWQLISHLKPKNPGEFWHVLGGWNARADLSNDALVREFLKADLEKIGLPVPRDWVRFLGVWIPIDEFDLCCRYWTIKYNEKMTEELNAKRDTEDS